MRIGILDDAYTFVDQATLKKFCHISIFSWQQLIATLDDRHLHTNAPECLREFASDRAAAKHDHAFRLSFKLIENRFVGEIRNLIDSFDFRNHRTASCSDHEILRAQLLPVYFYFTRREETCFAAENIHS